MPFKKIQTYCLKIETFPLMFNGINSILKVINFCKDLYFNLKIHLTLVLEFKYYFVTSNIRHFIDNSKVNIFRII